MHRTVRAALRIVTLACLAPFASSMAMALAPEFILQPTPQAAILGGRATFVVVANGSGPLAYQWRKGVSDLSDGGTISGATSEALTLTGVTAADAGDYSVVVTNPEGSATSVGAALTVTTPQGGDLDFSFDPGSSLNAYVDVVAVQPDGKVVIGGAFTSVVGAPRGGIARLNPDGTTDLSFGNGLSGANGEVFSLAVQPDGRVLIGGDFTTINGVSRSRVARLNADGSLDTTFLNGLAGANNSVFSVAVQADGRALIGGPFTTVNGVSRNHVARLNADGSLDTTFLNGLTGAGSNVYSVAAQPDGRVLIAGIFTSVNGVTRNYFARLNADGSLDTTFLNGLAGANSAVLSVAVQPDGRVLIGGQFTSVNGVSRNYVARLNADGSLDTTMSGLAGANDGVRSVAVQPDGRVLIGGGFTTINGMSRNYVARLNANGSLDTTFSTGIGGPNGLVSSVAAQPDGRVLFGGFVATINGVSRVYAARLNANGSLDTTFLNGHAGPNGRAFSVAVQSDGHVLIGGFFTTVNGVSRSRVARLNADDSLDTTFLNGLAGADSDVFAVAIQPDGRVLIGGLFGTVNGVSRSRVARLNADGSLDTTFLNGLSGASFNVYSVAVQPDGRVLVAGDFSTVNGVSRNRIARLNADGSLDTTFLNGLAGADDYVRSIAVQPDGRVLIGGQFTEVNGYSRYHVARLNADGSIDTNFLDSLLGVDQQVASVAVQPDGRVLIGGDFTSVNGVSRSRVARLNVDGTVDTTFLNGLGGANNSVNSVTVQSDGRVLIAGFFSMVNGVSRNYLARLNADGSLDTTFLNGLAGANSAVDSVAVQRDGRLLIGGAFASVNGLSRSYVARLYGSSPVAPVITVEPLAHESYDGCRAVFHVTATGTPRDYQWRKDGVDLVDGGNVSGARSDTLSLAGVSAADEGDYSVVVSNVVGSDTSLDSALTVAPVSQCKVATCDPVLGGLLLDAPDGTSCNDGNACTVGDTCSAGVCVGVVQPDSDYDGRGDLCDACPLDALDDQDGDAVCGDQDNCRTMANAGQADADGDGIGDACDLCPALPAASNNDGDHDGIGDACDPDVDGDGVPNAADFDDDGDLVPDDDDNCPHDSNPTQRDRDFDGIGDACDASDGCVAGGEVSVSASGTYTFSWVREDFATGYNVYSGILTELRSGSYGGCFRSGIVTTYTTLGSDVPAGPGRFYLVAPVYPDHVGSLGDRSDNIERPLPEACP